MYTAMIPDPNIIYTRSIRPDLLKLFSCLCSKPFQKNRSSLPFCFFHYSSKHIRFMQQPRCARTCYLRKKMSLKELSVPVQTLSNFPIEKLNGEVVLVRFDMNLVLNTSNSHDKSSLERAISTVKYVHNAKAKVLIATKWTESRDHITSSQESLSDATSNFGPIVSSYPGALVLVTIQYPNPDFNRDVYRWKMVRRTLVEAIIDLLAINGKVFLQSDVEAVTIEMREQFIIYGRGKMVSDVDDGEEWMEENPYGVHTDWEMHTMARGNPVYRTLLRKTG